MNLGDLWNKYVSDPPGFRERRLRFEFPAPLVASLNNWNDISDENRDTLRRELLETFGQKVVEELDDTELIKFPHYSKLSVGSVEQEPVAGAFEAAVDGVQSIRFKYDFRPETYNETGLLQHIDTLVSSYGATIAAQIEGIEKADDLFPFEFREAVVQRVLEETHQPSPPSGHTQGDFTLGSLATTPVV